MTLEISLLASAASGDLSGLRTLPFTALPVPFHVWTWAVRLSGGDEEGLGPSCAERNLLHPQRALSLVPRR